MKNYSTYGFCVVLLGLVGCGENPGAASRVDAGRDSTILFDVSLDALAQDATIDSVTTDGITADGQARDVASEASSDATVSACVRIPNGTGCAAPSGIVDRYVCVNGQCIPSQCGDGALDTSSASGHVPEQCDDGNTQPGDGCEPGCRPTCSSDANCDDSNLCTGRETCGAASSNGSRSCTRGTQAPNGTACGPGGDAGVSDGGAGVGRCTNGFCVLLTNCGNGAVDPGEQCDDRQDGDQTDGCTDECRFTCTTATAARDCDDHNACTRDTCDGGHRCVREERLCPRPIESCIVVSCDPAVGCVQDERTNDVDGDHYFRMNSSTDGCIGNDCDDSRATVNPGRSETCSDSLDNDCDGTVDNGVTTWYRDCDGDGVAPASAPTVVNCTEPAPAISCPRTNGPERWTTLNPSTPSNQDCNDSDYRAYPGANGYFTTASNGSSPASFDYNCDQQSSLQYTIGVQPACTGTYPTCDQNYYYRYVGGSTGCGATLERTYCTADFNNLPPSGPPLCISGSSANVQMGCR